MRKKPVSLCALALGLLLLCGACGGPEKPDSTTQPDAAGINLVVEPVNGRANGSIGDIMRTNWFDFTVSSATVAAAYGQYTPHAGYQLVDIAMALTGTFQEPVPMADSDFVVFWGSGDTEWDYSLDPLDDAMMPTEYELENGETITCHLLFEVPEYASTLTLNFIEQYVDNSSGSSFNVTLW